jgi:hypothetical protein
MWSRIAIRVIGRLNVNKDRRCTHHCSDSNLNPPLFEREEMAVVLRSTSDLVYLPDHGFVGEEGGKYHLTPGPETC